MHFVEDKSIFSRFRRFFFTFKIALGFLLLQAGVSHLFMPKLTMREKYVCICFVSQGLFYKCWEFRFSVIIRGFFTR